MQPVFSFNYHEHPINVYEGTATPQEIEQLTRDGNYAALWYLWHEEIDLEDFEEIATTEYLDSYSFSYEEYPDYTLEESFEAFDMDAQGHHTSESLAARIDWTEDPAEVMRPLHGSRLATTTAPSAGLAFCILANTASQNVVPAAACAHFLDYLEQHYGMHLVALGAEEVPEIVVRFPHPVSDEERLFELLTGLADHLICHREDNGALLVQIWWD